MKRALIALGIVACLGIAGSVWLWHQDRQFRASFQNPLFAQNPTRTFEFTLDPAQGFFIAKDRVRVMFIEHDAPANAEPKTLLRDVLVLAAEQRADNTMRAVLDVDAATAEQIRAAQKKGKVWLQLQPIA